MNTFLKLYKGFIRKPDRWFFYAFLVSAPLSIRKVIYTIQINGSFNEFSNISIFVSDIFAILLFFSYLYLLYNKYRLLSIIYAASFATIRIHSYCSTWNNLKNQRHRIFKIFAQVIHRNPIILLLIMGIFSLLSTLWSNHYELAIYRSLKIFEFSFIAWYVKVNVPRGTFMKNIMYIIVYLGVFNSLLAIYQFIIQKSIGLNWLKESQVSPESLNVAKIIFDDVTYIRAYGLFPHPNALAGFLLVSILFTYALYNYKINKNVPRGTFSSFTFTKMFHVEHYFQNISFIVSLFAIQLCALILTFSKSAVLGISISILYLYCINNRCRLSDLTKNIQLNYRKILLIGAILFTLSYLLKPSLDSTVIRSVQDRIYFINVSRGTFFDNPILGLGSGQYVVNLTINSNEESWKIAPVHNVYLLILNEIGLISAITFIILLFNLLNLNENVPRGTFFYRKNYILSQSILMGLCIIMVFDHYPWDIQQGQVLLYLIFGLLL